MSKLDKFKRKDKNSDNVWSSISDLMSGLMIVFLFTSVIFMSKVIDENTNIKKQQQTVENIVITYEDSKENIYEDLYNEFEGDMDNWHMEIDKDGTIRFKEPEVFFDMGESELKTQFKDILDSFFPRYINVIYTNYKDKVTEIRIEGHTSSEWEEGVDTKTAYFPMASICCSPPERVPANWFFLSSKRGKLLYTRFKLSSISVLSFLV